MQCYTGSSSIQLPRHTRVLFSGIYQVNALMTIQVFQYLNDYIAFVMIHIASDFTAFCIKSANLQQ